eukprot:CAMPEP_0176012604 /NCGR_PEP_ID=MMETSP0120_2-20121206/5880_1 /TAXON_ID=160619 /ORGANISM="Kryptoperidinium foliaceum, Strain CCMP 1326" /LENGTH=305 /DNA_ID=CAMNT_0017345493 /DNA_START=148 /DNA_END=1065 /DNA_ORIENTATION=+
MSKEAETPLTSIEAEHFLKATRGREDGLYAPMILGIDNLESQALRVFMECRRDMASWLIETSEVFGIEPATAEAAQRLLDRLCCIDMDLVEDFELYQVSCLACLIIACKMFQTKDTFRRKSGLQHLSKGFFSQEEIDHMELHVLYSLGWRVQPPTAVKIAESLLDTIPLADYSSIPTLAHTTTEINELIQLSLIDPRFMPFRASSVALAAVVHTLQPRMTSDQFQPLYQYFQGLLEQDDSVAEEREQLADLFMQLTPKAKDSGHAAVPHPCSDRVLSNRLGKATQSPSSSPRSVVPTKNLQPRTC